MRYLCILDYSVISKVLYNSKSSIDRLDLEDIGKRIVCPLYDPNTAV